MNRKKGQARIDFGCDIVIGEHDANWYDGPSKTVIVMASQTFGSRFHRRLKRASAGMELLFSTNSHVHLEDGHVEVHCRLSSTRRCAGGAFGFIKSPRTRERSWTNCFEIRVSIACEISHHLCFYYSVGQLSFLYTDMTRSLTSPVRAHLMNHVVFFPPKRFS